MANVYKTIGDLTTANPVTGSEEIEVFQDGKSRKVSLAEATKFDSYNVAVGTGTQLSVANQVTTIDNSTAAAKAITLPADLPVGRAMTLVVVVRGKAGAVTWDQGITWSGNQAPTLADNVTVAVLLWDGAAVHGSTGASY